MPDTGLMLSLVGGSGAYAYAVQRRWRAKPEAGWVEPIAFVSGIAVVAVALVSPLDGLSHRSLWVHMVQHVLLISVAAPLLALGHPVAVAREAWPALVPSFPRPGVWTVVVAAAAAQVLTLTVWHVPALYDAALAHTGVHAIEHLTLLVTAMGLWAALEAVEGEQGGLAVLALFIVSFPPLILGAAMTFAATTWYPAYATIGARAMTDQQLAGVIMWGYGSLAAVVGGVYLFVRWLQGLERINPARPPGHPSEIPVDSMPSC
jgi:cytochrome c oxidase assembly factor CtaG